MGGETHGAWSPDPVSLGLLLAGGGLYTRGLARLWGAPAPGGE